METFPRDFKGIWISAEIWLDDRLSLFEITLFSELHSLNGKDGCFASNEYLMNFFDVKERKLQDSLAKLKSLGYIWEESFDGRTRVLRTTLTPDKSFFSTSDPQNPAPLTRKISEKATGQHTLYRKKSDIKEQQQERRNNSSCSSSDADKIKSMETLNLGNPTMQRALKFSLEEIKTAIQCCLNPSKDIDNIDGYFMSALTEKWQPKRSKAKKEALKEETEKQQQQNRQRIYAEAKQLEIAHKYNLRDTASFSVNENSIVIKINGAFAPCELNDESLKILKKYIKDNQTKTAMKGSSMIKVTANLQLDEAK